MIVRVWPPAPVPVDHPYEAPPLPGESFQERVDRLAAEARAADAATKPPAVPLEEARTILGPKASKRGWGPAQCRTAARCRVEIAGGCDGAGTWDGAINGEITEDGAYCIAVQGIGGAATARARWLGKVDDLRRVAAGVSA